MPGLTSAAGLIGLLDEPDQQIRSYALMKLNEVVHEFWAELAGCIPILWVACVEIFDERDWITVSINRL
jgi:hypothetical protein